MLQEDLQEDLDRIYALGDHFLQMSEVLQTHVCQFVPHDAPPRSAKANEVKSLREDLRALQEKYDLLSWNSEAAYLEYTTLQKKYNAEDAAHDVTKIELKELQHHCDLEGM